MPRLPLLLLLVASSASCRSAAVEPLPGLSVEHDLRTDPDAAIVRQHSQLLRREGPVLYVRSGAGERAYRDRGACAGFDTCARHRAAAVLRDRYVAVEIGHGEGRDVLLIDTSGGNEIQIGGRPHASPSGELFFVGYMEEIGDWSPLMGASVWRLSDTGAVADRLRLVDMSLVYFSDFLGWRSDRCVAFQGARTLEAASEGASRTFYLAARGIDWELSEAAPPECASGAGR